MSQSPEIPAPELSKNATPDPGKAGSRPPGSSNRFRAMLFTGTAVILLYLLVAYVILPLAWKKESARHRALLNGPHITHTVDGIPGDPINVALLGSETELIRDMVALKWYPADPITLRSSLRIAVDSVLRRPDDDAPVSTLMLFGRKQDLAFEQPVGDSPRKRHHVRFWRWDQLEDGSEVWFGSATYDERVGLSHTTGQITHHIAPDVDSERDRILSQLKEAGLATEIYWLPGFQTELEGKNGGGDPWHTDGRLGVAKLTTRDGVSVNTGNTPTNGSENTVTRGHQASGQDQ